MKTPKIFSLLEDHCISTGGLVRKRQGPNYRPSHLPRLSLEPVPASKRAYTRKTSRIAVSERAITVVSSAYRETTGKGVETCGSRKPGMALLARKVSSQNFNSQNVKEGRQGTTLPDSAGRKKGCRRITVYAHSA